MRAGAPREDNGDMSVREKSGSGGGERRNDKPRSGVYAKSARRVKTMLSPS